MLLSPRALKTAPKLRRGIERLKGEIAEIERRALDASGYPVVYVRGFAGGKRGIDEAVDDPFYGFNDGSTHIRVGGNNDPQYFQFESPLLRLIADEGYQILVEGDQERYLQDHEEIPGRTIWVYRFYDDAATTFGHDRTEPFSIEQAAEGLYDFVQLVRSRTGAAKVLLVAHSMGGLICRSMLQQASYRSDQGKPRTPGCELVDKLFTYGTPHGGISARFGSRLTDWVTSLPFAPGTEIFTPDKMYGYLKRGAQWGDEPGPADAGWHPSMTEDFPADRIFCLVGTDAADYGRARHLIGPQSDGLVEIKNAYVRGAHRAYVHRAHSGRYGMVNSEEGYQNLRRFLFGSHRIDVGLLWPQPLAQGGPAEVRMVWQAELEVSVRGLPVVMHQQLLDHHCPIQLGDAMLQARRQGLDRVALTTVFLRHPEAAEGEADGARLSRCALHLRVMRLEERQGRLLQHNYLAHAADFDDVLIVDVDTSSGADLRMWAAWRSEIAGATGDYHPGADNLPELRQGDLAVVLPTAGASLLTETRLVLTPGHWGNVAPTH